MAQRLRTSTSCAAKALHLVPSIHIRQLTTAWNSSSRSSNTLSGLWAPGTPTVHTDARRQNTTTREIEHKLYEGFKIAD